MDLTSENKEHIDNMDYEELLLRWRNAFIGDVWFQGETGEYWGNRMTQLRAEPGGSSKHILASKSIG